MNRNFDFCPYCGNNMTNKISNRENYGLLGENDNVNDMFNPRAMGIGGSFMDKMLGNAIKMLEKEFGNMEKDQVKNLPKSNFQVFINGKRVNTTGNFENEENLKVKNQRQMAKATVVSDETIKNSFKLPKKEAKIKLTRLNNKIIYELETPNLRSLENVLINKLEQSIEIRVYTDKAVYFKNLPIKLPLLKYYIDQDRLFLEFQAK